MAVFAWQFIDLHVQIMKHFLFLTLVLNYVLRIEMWFVITPSAR